jgi:hypothetical protein
MLSGMGNSVDVFRMVIISLLDIIYSYRGVCYSSNLMY